MKAPLILTNALIFLLAIAGCGGSPEHQTTLGTHTLTIVDSSTKPWGGTTRIHQDDQAGTETHFFESANGRYKIRLEDDVMTVNGVKYTLNQPESAIRIVDDRVEINWVEASPDTE